MKTIFSKLLLVLTFNFLLSIPLYAKVVEQNKIDFPIKADELLKGEIHYYFSILTPQKLAVQHGDVFELDSLALTQESNVQMVLTKSVYVVNKPVGFFDDKQLSEEKYISHVLGEQKLKKLNPATYKVSVPGGLTYKMQMYFDSDDVSTLPNSKIIRGVNAVKNLDVISKSASTVMFTEKTNFSADVEGGVSASSYVPLNEKKTLVITYNLYAVKKEAVNENALKDNFLIETASVKKLQESYKESGSNLP